MNKISVLSVLLVLISSMFVVSSCNMRRKPILLETKPIIDISTTTASTGGNIINKKEVEINARGVCWSRSEDPSVRDYKTDEGRGKGGYITSLKGLAPGTTYYLRAYAIAGMDTVYGNIISFTTKDYGEVTDIEGNRYRTIKIGAQTWMAENLRATRFNDSSSITLIEKNDKWAAQSSPAYCWYKNSEDAFKSMYGAIYNWYTVNTGKLCPAGWHVPSNSDWDELANFLGSSDVAGGILKETGEEYWSTPNTGATNQYRFSALPGGLRYYDGEFRDFGFGGYWWSSSELSDERAFFRHIFYQDGSLFRFDNEKRNGFYVRCISD